MNVLVVTGIFPPAIGGPATHAVDVAVELEARGHRVSVLTLADVDEEEAGGNARDAPKSGPVVRFPRSWWWPRRSARMVAWMVAHRGAFDVVYATGLGPVA